MKQTGPRVDPHRQRIIRRLLLGLGAAGLAVLFTFLASTQTTAPLPDAISEAELVALGEPLYAAQCASCHGVNLEGQPNWKRQLPEGGYPAPPHDASGHTWHHPDSLLFKITKFGGQASAPRAFRSNMPAFKGVLTDTEIWAVLAFIKSRWPDAVRAKQVQITREQK